MRQVIRLTESDLHRIVKQVITEAVEEMDKPNALKGMTIYAATDRMIGNGEFKSTDREGNTVRTNPVNIKARKLADKAIMHYVVQELKPHLSFRMMDKTHPNGHVGVEFDVQEIKEYNETQMQLYGFMVSADWKGYIKKHATIKCVFDSDGKEGSPFGFKFYLIQNLGTTTRTPSMELLGEPENEETIRNIISEIYKLRQEAQNNASTMTDLSGFRLNGGMNIKPPKKYKK